MYIYVFVKNMMHIIIYFHKLIIMRKNDGTGCTKAFDDHWEHTLTHFTEIVYGNNEGVHIYPGLLNDRYIFYVYMSSITNV
jgi:hypothetical protein